MRMKVRRPVGKASRACDDDWDEDYPPYYETGQSFELSGPVERPRFRSVSPAAHAAIHAQPARQIGFHKPKA